MSRHSVIGGDIAGLFACFAALRQKAVRRKNILYPLVVIQEAGLDGSWLGRVLSKEAWIEGHIVEAASIAMPRRHRRAKTDRIDGETLIRALMAWKRGEPRACSMVKLLSPEEDDNRRIGRERKTLIAERVFHVNRIKGLLYTQGISVIASQPMLWSAFSEQITNRFDGSVTARLFSGPPVEGACRLAARLNPAATNTPRPVSSSS